VQGDDYFAVLLIGLTGACPKTRSYVQASVICGRFYPILFQHVKINFTPEIQIQHRDQITIPKTNEHPSKQSEKNRARFIDKITSNAHSDWQM
jgi:hypothetical protein